MKKETISVNEFMNVLSKHFQYERQTTLNRMRREKNAFKILIGCLVSINIKDEVTEKILTQLFLRADSFKKILAMSTKELEDILYFARYRRMKAAILKSVSKEIIQRFNGNVPSTREELLSIKGIGPKTANVVLNFAFDERALPVDSNTLRIANRIGWIRAEKHDEVEKMLVNHLDEIYFKEANALFMLLGKTICVPVSPFCSRCPVNKICLKVGVEKSR
ncbi:MAG: endonuclease III [Nanoarchaeota archaeon]